MSEDRLISARPAPIGLSPVVQAPQSFVVYRYVPPRLQLARRRHERPQGDRNRPWFSRWARAGRRSNR